MAIVVFFWYVNSNKIMIITPEKLQSRTDIPKVKIKDVMDVINKLLKAN